MLEGKLRSPAPGMSAPGASGNPPPCGCGSVRARRDKVSSFPYESSSELTRHPERVPNGTPVCLEGPGSALVGGETWGYEMFLGFHTLFLTLGHLTVFLFKLHAKGIRRGTGISVVSLENAGFHFIS